jgi:hypothetical protein
MWEGIKGRGLFGSSPSPQPSPINRERGYEKTGKCYYLSSLFLAS